MLNSIEGHSVIVTGASKGIGKGIAKVFATKGARVLVVARNIGPAEATANEIRAAGGKSLSASCTPRRSSLRHTTSPSTR